MNDVGVLSATTRLLLSLGIAQSRQWGASTLLFCLFSLSFRVGHCTNLLKSQWHYSMDYALIHIPSVLMNILIS